MNISLSDRTFLNIVFNSQIIRIYWINNKFVLTHNDMNLVLSFGFTEHSYKSSGKVVSYVMKHIHNTINIDVKLFYNKMETSKKNIASIADMMEIDDGNYTENTQIKRLILLNLLILCA